MAIYVKFKPPKDLRDFLKQFFSVYVEYDAVGVETYSDQECTKVQCKAGKWRSFDNILELAQTYYPKTTAKKLFKTLLTLKLKDRENQVCNLYPMSCEDIGKINMVFANDSVDYEEMVDQYKYNSEYSWSELLEMVGIESQKDLDEFIKNKK